MNSKLVSNIALQSSLLFISFFFYVDSQYRQIKSTESGSVAGFLYFPNFHAVLNVLKDYFNSCCHVCIIFCGKINYDSHIRTFLKLFVQVNKLIRMDHGF